MTGFNINEFKGNIDKYGVVQTNKFLVLFNSPAILQGTSIADVSRTTLSSETERMMTFRAESVKVPGIALQSTDINRYGYGPMQKMPFNAAFTPNSVTFISDKNGEIYKYFYAWIANIFNFSGTTSGSTNIGASYRVEHKDYYTTDLHVYVFDNFGNLVKDIVMYRAFPESMNEITLGWGDNNALMKVTVTFSYRDWAMVGLSVNNLNNAVDPNIANAFTTFNGNLQTAPTAIPSLVSSAKSNNNNAPDPGKVNENTQ
jgi:hypothetical protein